MRKISVITPCFNEEDNVEVCASELRKVMFETPGFNSFDLFSELREYGPAK
jgi:glycosyltransferase involved in cell wall biosynthesis